MAIIQKQMLDEVTHNFYKLGKKGDDGYGGTAIGIKVYELGFRYTSQHLESLYTRHTYGYKLYKARPEFSIFVRQFGSHGKS